MNTAMDNEAFSELPRNGRIGRFVKILEKERDRDSALKVLENVIRYNSLSHEQKSAWWKNAIEKLVQYFGKDIAVKIMKACGDKCCGNGQRATARRIMSEAGSLESFLVQISKHDVGEGDLTYTLESDNTIIADHNKCFCKQVSNTKHEFLDLTYCQCSVEFNRQFFSAALGKNVQVELLQSIICGAESCRFRITF
jgi:predicted hydrocarbon binding protein